MSKSSSSSTWRLCGFATVVSFSAGDLRSIKAFTRSRHGNVGSTFAYASAIEYFLLGGDDSLELDVLRTFELDRSRDFSRSAVSSNARFRLFACSSASLFCFSAVCRINSLQLAWRSSSVSSTGKTKSWDWDTAGSSRGSSARSSWEKVSVGSIETGAWGFGISCALSSLSIAVISCDFVGADSFATLG